MNDDLTRQLLERVRELERRLGIQETIEFGASHTHAAYVALTGDQAVAGVKTFSDGIAFANETLSTYDQGTWTPALTGSATDATLTYTARAGYFTQIGNTVNYWMRMEVNTISGAGTGNLVASLPVIASADVTGYVGHFVWYDADVARLKTGAFFAAGGDDIGTFVEDGAAGLFYAVGAMGNGDVFTISGSYKV